MTHLTTAVLALLCVYHLVIGALSVGAPHLAARFARGVYGFSLRLDAQSTSMLRALGLYALFTGAVLGLTLWDVARWRPILLCMAGLQLARAVHRLRAEEVVVDGLGASPSRNRLNAGLLLAEAIILGLGFVSHGR